MHSQQFNHITQNGSDYNDNSILFFKNAVICTYSVNRAGENPGDAARATPGARGSAERPSLQRLVQRGDLDQGLRTRRRPPSLCFGVVQDHSMGLEIDVSTSVGVGDSLIA